MIRSTALAFIFTLLCSPAFSQISPPTMTVKKFFGQNITFTWEYDVVDEAGIAHFSLKRADSLTGPFTELKPVLKNLRTIATNANFATGSQFVYYAISAVKVIDPAKPIESSVSNTVAVERTERNPRNLTLE